MNSTEPKDTKYIPNDSTLVYTQELQEASRVYLENILKNDIPCKFGDVSHILANVADIVASILTPIASRAGIESHLPKLYALLYKQNIDSLIASLSADILREINKYNPENKQ